jgi:hypothetical protein
MRKFIAFLLIVAALQACGSSNAGSRGMDQGSAWGNNTPFGPDDIPPSYAHPAGGTMKTKP